MLGFFISLLLSSLPAQAVTSVSCDGVTGVVREVVFLEHEDCALAKSLSDIFNQMAVTFKSSAAVNLVIGGPSDNASFDNGHIVQVPYRMVFYGKYGRKYETHLSNLYTSAAHEYGHAIFHEHLRTTAGPEFADLFSKLDQLSARKLAILKGASDVSFVGDSTNLVYSPQFRLISSRMAAYAEFFADVLAVYHFQDRQAMVKALYHDGLDDFQYNYIRLRDFSSQPDPKWEHLLSEDHVKLSPARAFVGKHLWPQNADQSQEMSDWILFCILRVLAQDLESEEEPEWELANQNLIRELESALPTVGTEAFSR
ncbi:hypothetical protein [Bdellovibrio bacteriovorus]|uniref:hypothetical protein n=1 Tax=Bdellovibrio bacteriovorus TaxID=959 RepID=UPI003CFE06F6